MRHLKQLAELKSNPVCLIQYTYNVQRKRMIHFSINVEKVKKQKEFV